MSDSEKAARTRASARRRAWLLCVVLIAGGAALAVPVACLPDLAAIPPAPPSNTGCGDGVIATLDDGGDAGESCDPGTNPPALGCVDCQITCEGTLDPRTGHCYFSPPGPASHSTGYQDALNGCRGEGAHVVTFASADEIAVASKVAAAESYWIGLLISDEVGGAYQSIAPDEPGYAYPPAGAAATGPCPGCFGVGANADSGLFPVADLSGSPGTSPDTHCVASRGGSWFQVPCRGVTSRRVLCEREPAGVRVQACSNNLCLTVPATAGHKTYLVVVSSADPQTAAQSCNSLAGGSLVVFGSHEEREQIARELFLRNPDSEQEFWIGLSADGEDGGAWRWEDGVAADPVEASLYPFPWGKAQPPSSVATTSARAYIRVGATTAYDTELAVADTIAGDAGGTPRRFICQRPSP